MVLKFRNKPIPVKLDDALMKRIEEVARKMGEHKSTVMRIAMRIGLEGLQKTFEKAPEIAAGLRYGEHQPQNLTLNEPSSAAKSGETADEKTMDVIAKRRRPKSPPDK